MGNVDDHNHTFTHAKLDFTHAASLTPLQPWLQHGMSKATEPRVRLVELLGIAIYENFIVPDDGEWLRKTGEIVNVSHLRNSKNRCRFNRIVEIGKDTSQKRLWTVSLFKACLYYVLSEKQLLVPLTSDFTIEAWVQEQSKKLHQLVRRAAKNRWQEERFAQIRCANMDNMETQPQFPEWWDEDFM